MAPRPRDDTDWGGSNWPRKANTAAERGRGAQREYGQLVQLHELAQRRLLLRPEDVPVGWIRLRDHGDEEGAQSQTPVPRRLDQGEEAVVHASFSRQTTDTRRRGMTDIGIPERLWTGATSDMTSCESTPACGK